jgi:hypothetical protein
MSKLILMGIGTSNNADYNTWVFEADEVPSFQRPLVRALHSIYPR